MKMHYMWFAAVFSFPWNDGLSGLAERWVSAYMSVCCAPGMPFLQQCLSQCGIIQHCWFCFGAGLDGAAPGSGARLLSWVLQCGDEREAPTLMVSFSCHEKIPSLEEYRQNRQNPRNLGFGGFGSDLLSLWGPFLSHF
jgi:hypothetical protein